MVQVIIREKHGKGEVDSNIKQWDRILQQYGYSQAEQFEKLLINFAETGYLEMELFRKEAAQLNEKAKSQQNRVIYHHAWEIFYNSFADNEDEFISALFQSFSGNISSFGPRDLESVVQMLETLERPDLAMRLIDLYTAQNKDSLGPTTMENLMTFHRVKDKEIIQRIRQIQEDYRKDKGLGHIIRDFTTNKGISNSSIEIDYLASCPVEEYYDFFKSEDSHLLYNYIKTCLDMHIYEHTSKNAATVTNKAKEALVRIASESRFNRLRLESMRDLELELPPEEPSSILLRRLLFRRDIFNED